MSYAEDSDSASPQSSLAKSDSSPAKKEMSREWVFSGILTVSNDKKWMLARKATLTLQELIETICNAFKQIYSPRAQEIIPSQQENIRLLALLLNGTRTLISETYSNKHYVLFKLRINDSILVRQNQIRKGWSQQSRIRDQKASFNFPCPASDHDSVLLSE